MASTRPAVAKSTKKRVLVVVFAIALIPVGWFAYAWLTYPSDRTPEGAYLRVMSAVNRGQPELFFAYIETRAQHACFTIGDYRKRAHDRVKSSYAEPERSQLMERWAEEAARSDGPQIFSTYAKRERWLNRLRRDMSGVRSVEVQGERATVVTARGTRYPFRRRDNGIWGLTLFTPTLVAEAERAARDFALVDKNAADLERVGTAPSAKSP